jgi:23S rRNA pseudouridine1911/1915/1917 synthase
MVPPVPEVIRVRFTVERNYAGWRLDRYLAEKIRRLTPEKIEHLIAHRLESADGRPLQPDTLVTPGLAFALLREVEPEPETPMTFGVVHDDGALLVVDKPAGLVTHPAPGHRGVTLAELLPAGSKIVHRLDKDTSGLLVVARSEEVRDALQGMIRAREVTREYTALVEGHPDTGSGTIDAPIGRDRGNRTVMSTRTDRARDAVTHFEVVERLPRTALLRVRLETGRTHQIRAHLAAIGHPVVGDPQYGGRESGRRIGLERQFLHASKLMFRHPLRREWVRCESKPPVELSHALDTARREPVSGGPDGD